MKPADLKFSIVARCLLAMLVGALVLVAFMQEGRNPVGMTVGALMILLPASVMITRLPRLWKYQAQTLEWYRNAYPKLVSNDRVACFECGSNHIEQRPVSQHTGHHGHVCGQCDTTLFYS